jgi:hypothetical protein
VSFPVRRRTLLEPVPGRRLQYRGGVSTKPGDGALMYRLVDDAAMFPPGNASAETAVREHLRHRRSWYSTLVGPLLVHAGRWQELTSVHERAGSPALDVVVIASPPSGVPGAFGLRVVGYEQAATDPLGLPLLAPTAVELVDPAQYTAELTGVAAARLSGADVIAKYRTGGTVPEAFPAEDAVARVIAAAVRLDVPLKFTAGLHHAVRHTDTATGLERHGFLNLMVAVRCAQQGADEEQVAAAVALRDVGAVVDVVRSWSADEVSQVRHRVRSFGCCGVEEPVADAVALGLVEQVPA